LSVDEFAVKTPFEPVTIRRACQRKEIPGAVKRLGRWCIPASAAESWLEEEPTADDPDAEDAVGMTAGTVTGKFRELVGESR
jgi:hypothetical protein